MLMRPVLVACEKVADSLWSCVSCILPTPKNVFRETSSTVVNPLPKAISVRVPFDSLAASLAAKEDRSSSSLGEETKNDERFKLLSVLDGLRDGGVAGGDAASGIVSIVKVGRVCICFILAHSCLKIKWTCQWLKNGQR
jgi:hypothetical protein